MRRIWHRPATGLLAAALLVPGCTVNLSTDESQEAKPQSVVISPPDPDDFTPIASGIQFGQEGNTVTITGVSDSISSSKKVLQLQGMRDRVEQVAKQLKGTAIPTESAALTGTTADFGSFTYTYSADGSITPDPAWVAEYIRTEPVPILGSVTCHKLMLPPLRAALQQVVDEGLADKIHPGEYGGCYVPRFIGSDPRNPISLHTWGIAIDLNVPGNLRGTVGEIDRRVVEIFQSWGYNWGGTWSWTDPMHFELAALY